MTSEKQVQANRRNALKSTGPKTQEGKDIVRHNAVKHGLLSQEVLLPDEDEAAFRELGERLREELQPAIAASSTGRSLSGNSVVEKSGCSVEVAVGTISTGSSSSSSSLLCLGWLRFLRASSAA